MTKPDFFIEEDKILTALFDEGLELLHLYKPNTEPVYSERLLSLIPDSYCKKIVVHAHYYLKNEFGRPRDLHILGQRFTAFSPEEVDFYVDGKIQPFSRYYTFKN